MVALGILLLVIGLLAGSGLLLWLGVILLIVGAVLHFTPARSPYGRYWY